MKKELYLSLCIPTNGVHEWVIPVLNSIYSDDCDTGIFEVIVTDNGQSSEFEKAMREYGVRYSNFIYKKTDALVFLNQIEAFKFARGQLIKFINHRMTLLPGAVEYLCEFAKKHIDSNPVVYFSNGALKLDPVVSKCGSFDEYVRTLSYLSSWSAGTAMWKVDFDKMDLNQEFNKLFPHTDIIFFNKKSSEYIVDDTLLLHEIPSDNTKKGNYDLFNAFALEYPSVINGLLEEGAISEQTFKYVKRKNGYFVSGLYLEYVIRKKSCSYNLNGYKKATGKYYSNLAIKFSAILQGLKLIVKKIGKDSWNE